MTPEKEPLWESVWDTAAIADALFQLQMVKPVGWLFEITQMDHSSYWLASVWEEGNESADLYSSPSVVCRSHAPTMEGALLALTALLGTPPWANARAARAERAR